MVFWHPRTASSKVSTVVVCAKKQSMAMQTVLNHCNCANGIQIKTINCNETDLTAPTHTSTCCSCRCENPAPKPRPACPKGDLLPNMWAKRSSGLWKPLALRNWLASNPCPPIPDLPKNKWNSIHGKSFGVVLAERYVSNERVGVVSCAIVGVAENLGVQIHEMNGRRCDLPKGTSRHD